MIRRIIITVILLLSGSFLSAQEMLNAYLETAAENNPGLRAAFYEYSAALEKIPQTKTLPDPRVSFGYFIQPVETRNGPQEARFSVSQMFPWFGTLKTRKNVAAFQAKARFEAFEETKAKLYYDVRITYYDLYFIRQEKQIMKESIRILKHLEALVQSKRETGQATGTDEIRLSMELAGLENDLASLEDRERTLEFTFLTLLNVKEVIPVEYPAGLPIESYVNSKEALLETIKVENPRIRMLENVLESSRFSEKLAKKQGMPDLSLGVDYGIIGTTGNPADNPGKDVITFPVVGLNIPLYRKKYNAVKNEAVFMRKSAEEKQISAMNQLESEFEEVFERLTDAKRRVKLNEMQMKRSKSALELLKSDYMTHGGNFEEVLRMERQKITYSIALEKAMHDQRKSVARLKFLNGE
ncbi:MAG: outer membrane efflux protein [Marinimicrobia bacterium 46_47]|nr:MAG: outer membrane efflux protein [Marinimicrobia bacterium 46_47]HBY18909.1 hypothetical protein [Candidatus Neomarinimicrobiota bacterium]